MRKIFGVAVLALFGVHAAGNGASAENWIRPLKNDAYWWIDLDSKRSGPEGRPMFKLHMGANPKGRYDAMMNYTHWAAIDCAATSLYNYNEKDKSWSKLGDGGSDLERALAQLLCR